jgi:ribonuclease P protein component
MGVRWCRYTPTKILEELLCQKELINRKEFLESVNWDFELDQLLVEAGGCLQQDDLKVGRNWLLLSFVIMKEPWSLTKRAQYSAVYRQGYAYVSALIVMKILRNGFDYNRYGLSVSKAVGKAVIRNRVKRQLREICRLYKLSTGWDIVLIARREASTARYYQLRDTVIRLMAQAGLLFEDSETTGTNFN